MLPVPLQGTKREEAYFRFLRVEAGGPTRMLLEHVGQALSCWSWSRATIMATACLSPHTLHGKRFQVCFNLVVRVGSLTESSCCRRLRTNRRVACAASGNINNGSFLPGRGREHSAQTMLDAGEGDILLLVAMGNGYSHALTNAMQARLTLAS